MRREVAQAHHFAQLAGAHQADLHAAVHFAVEHSDQADHAFIGVVPAIEDQRPRRLAAAVGRRRHAIDDRFEHLVDADAFLGAGQDRVRGVEPDDFFDLRARALDVGAGQVDLVDHRHDLQPVIQRHINVGQGLRFHALAGINHQQRALAGGQAARDFVGEIDVAGRVDQIQDVGAAVVARGS